MSFLLRLFGRAAAAGLFLLPAAVRASPPPPGGDPPIPVAVLGLLAGGRSPAEAAEAGELGGLLRNVVAANPRFRLADSGLLGVEEALLAFGCVEGGPTCMAEVGRSVGAELLVHGTLRAVEGGFAITVEVVDVTDGTVFGRLDRTFPEKGLEPAFRTEASLFLEGMAARRRTAIEVLCPGPGPTVTVDGRPAGSCPLAQVSVAPGRHAVEVSGAGYVPWSSSVEVPRGSVRRVRPALLPTAGSTDASGLAEASPGVAAEDAGGGRGLRVAGWCALAGAVAAGAAASVVGVLLQGVQEEYDRTTSPRRAEEYARIGERYATTANALFGTTAVLGVGGLVLLLLSHSD